MGEVKSSDDIFFTRSMAEILEGQGKNEDAMMIYTILQGSSVDAELTEFYKTKIETLKQRAKSKKK